MKRSIKYLVVHCTATSQAATIESIKAGWREKGWNNPGYHYLVKPNGMIVQLQDEEKIANGVKGFNKESIHISYIGGIDKEGKPLDNRTKEQQESIFNKLMELLEKYPGAEIRGHRDFSPDKDGDGVIEWYEYIKCCPCFEVKQWLKDYVPDIGNAA